MTAFHTMSQDAMREAADNVAAVKGMGWESEYKSICKSFPVMVLTCGLCQAIAFVSAKAKSGKEEDGDGSPLVQANKRILEHVAAVLKPVMVQGSEPKDVANVPITEYMQLTRRLLHVWSFYKRFADALLDTGKTGGQS